MIKNIPVTKVRSSETTKELVLISVHILNMELRPHLTRWQARYRRWWNSVVNDPVHKDVPPQQLQRTYPQHAELIAEIKAVNDKLVIYVNHLKKWLAYSAYQALLSGPDALRNARLYPGRFITQLYHGLFQHPPKPAGAYLG